MLKINKQKSFEHSNSCRLNGLSKIYIQVVLYLILLFYSRNVLLWVICIRTFMDILYIFISTDVTSPPMHFHIVPKYLSILKSLFYQ